MVRPVADPDPPYLRIVAELRRRIASGELAPGARVPSTRQITQQWGVAMATATKVLSTLRQEGLVRALPGVGTVVGPAAPVPRSPRTVARPAPNRAGAPAPAPRREQELTRERIVRAATDLADTEGLAVVTMRRIATELGVATMSLYRHVRGKDHLVLLMTDAALGEDPLPEPPPPGWRAQLELLCRLQWATYRRHPWLAQVVSLTRPLISANGLAHTEWAMRAVSGLGLPPAVVVHVAATMANYVRGTAVSLEREAEAEQDTGITDDQWMRAQDTRLAALFESGAYPILASVSARPDVDLNLNSLFDFGLEHLLDGLSTRLEPE